MEREERSWQRYIETTAFAYNTKINEATQLTPFKALIGRPVKLPINLILPTPQKRYENEVAYIQDTMLRFKRRYKHMCKHREAQFWPEHKRLHREPGKLSRR